MQKIVIASWRDRRRSRVDKGQVAPEAVARAPRLVDTMGGHALNDSGGRSQESSRLPGETKIIEAPFSRSRYYCTFISSAYPLRANERTTVSVCPDVSLTAEQRLRRCHLLTCARDVVTMAVPFPLW